MSGYHHSLHKQIGSSGIIGIVASSEMQGLFLIVRDREDVILPYLLTVYPQGNSSLSDPFLARGWEEKEEFEYEDFEEEEDEDEEVVEDEDDFFEDDYSEDEDDDFDADDDYDDEFEGEDEDDF